MEKIIDTPVTKEMKTSFLDYAYSVIYSRALPDATDGLKPVQRRIIYQMYKMGLDSNKGFVKSARVVGDVMGKLHPHGDGAIYDALVRLSQEWTLRLPLVDPHGNFGSLDDGPAASRYTEARLTRAAMLMTANLEENAVDMVPNYDNQIMQPKVLPSRFPNLLINGTQGIAVGMATNMAPHNPREIINGLKFLIDNPKAQLDEITKFIPGPDFPSGGRILDLSGVIENYKSGRGIFKLRANAKIEKVRPAKMGIVITELPYQIGTERILSQIKDLVNSKKIQGISAAIDLTDRKNGLKIVVEIKAGFNPEQVLNTLFAKTSMEISFGANCVALVNGKPKTLSLLELMQVYLDHYLDFTTRQLKFRLKKFQQELHLVDGLLIAVASIDEVIEVIRSSENSKSAKTRLCEIFDLNEKQAEYILDLQLRRLTKYSILELENQKNELNKKISSINDLLNSKPKLWKHISNELEETANLISTPRKTVLLDSSSVSIQDVQGEQIDTTSETTIKNNNEQETDVAFVNDQGEYLVLLSNEGVIAKTTTTSANGYVAPHKIVVQEALGVITSFGRAIKINTNLIPLVPPTQSLQILKAGIPITDFLSLENGEKIISLVNLDSPIALCTKLGTVKRVELNKEKLLDSQVITMENDDYLIGASNTQDTSRLVFISSDAKLLTFPSNLVRMQGEKAKGMAGIKLSKNAQVVNFNSIKLEDLLNAQVATIADDANSLPGVSPGSIKISPLDIYPTKGRATGGVLCMSFLKGQNVISNAYVGLIPINAFSVDSQSITLPEVSNKRAGSGKTLDKVAHIIF